MPSLIAVLRAVETIGNLRESQFNSKISKVQNRLLKVCYMPATSASLSGFFFAEAINSTNEANKAGGTCL